MKKYLLLFLLLAQSNFLIASQPNSDVMASNIAIVIHGGAGWSRNQTEEKLKSIEDGLKRALDEGFAILESGGTSLDAVEAAVVILEDDVTFNAGKGSVYTAEEKQEMDASIMTGELQNAGAVASVSTIKNPIKLARYVMEKTEHVLIVGQGAEKVAIKGGLEVVDPSYFYSKEKLDRVRRQKTKDELSTVGAVAIDKEGNISAATSTGGRSNKLPGRVGDSPIIGAGTWAQNNLCGVSGTGHGEYFMRFNVAREICVRMDYLGLTADQASNQVIDELSGMGIEGGVIVIDKEGNASMIFNTDGMARAYKNSKGDEIVTIY
ncbi:MAG: isoaspartyl peptidase/L-asparaginase [Gammaproteobacteria bacterium]|nr:isoaspartyl peptidase/L-asparaginase [Gammaproteobacteria bacterium]|tara:strand:+ start:85 stop:1047 length:963 start_codon:yes stop_codon:yes gene_type:complete